MSNRVDRDSYLVSCSLVPCSRPIAIFLFHEKMSKISFESIVFYTELIANGDRLLPPRIYFLFIKCLVFSLFLLPRGVCFSFTMPF